MNVIRGVAFPTHHSRRRHLALSQRVHVPEFSAEDTGCRFVLDEARPELTEMEIILRDLVMGIAHDRIPRKKRR